MKTRPPANNRRVEADYYRHLSRIARYVGRIITDMPPDDPQKASALQNLLNRYADALDPWAKTVAGRMLEQINQRDYAMWRKHSQDMSAGVKRALMGDDGELTRALLDTQVDLIKSIPRDAGKRVHELSLELVVSGERSTSIVDEIMRSTQVSLSKAKTIARTEVSRATSTFAEARAKRIGSEGYFWRTAEDADVRQDHKELNGKFFTWDNPPIADQRNGARAHPGCIYNCRCYAEIIIPD